MARPIGNPRLAHLPAARRRARFCSRCTTSHRYKDRSAALILRERRRPRGSIQRAGGARRTRRGQLEEDAVDNRVRIALRLDRQLGTADMREMDEAGERYAAFIGKKAEVLHNR